MKEVNFSQPQRQSVSGIVIMFLDAARSVVSALWPLLLIFALRSGNYEKVILVGILVAIAAVALVLGWLRYRNFTFWIDEQNAEFILSEGIINKTRTVISLDKIQQVNISQTVIQKLIGVHALVIDTAGSGDKEVKIKSVSHPVALALKQRLLEVTPKSDTALTDEDAATPILKISLASLVKTGLTSNYVKTIGILMAFAVTVGDQLRTALTYEELEENVNRYLDPQQFAVSAVAVMVAILLLFVLLFNLGRTVVRYFNFTILAQKGSLLLNYGLLSTRNTIIRPGRVQITQTSHNYFQKKLGVCELRVLQAGVQVDEHHREKENGLDIPGCSPAERDRILNLLYGTVPQQGAELKPHLRKLIILVFVTIVLPLGVFFGLGLYADVSAFVPVAVVLSVFLALIHYFNFKNYRLFAGRRFIIRQGGAWDVTQKIIETGKIQSVSVSQRLWHRKADIGTIVLHTAGGDIRFNFANFTQVKQWANYWLYQMEKENTNWM